MSDEMTNKASDEKTTKKAPNEIETKCGLSAGKVDQWKSMYGDNVHYVEIGGSPYIYRGLSRMEWKRLNSAQDLSNTDMLEKEELVTKAALLHPGSFDNATSGSAGVPSVIFALVAAASKFEPDMAPIKL